MPVNKQGVRDLSGLRPAVLSSNAIPEPIAPPFREDIMEWFTYAHLPAGPMRETSVLFAALAEHVHATFPRSAERSTALRKLLEGKDAAVRCAKPRPGP